MVVLASSPDKFCDVTVHFVNHKSGHPYASENGISCIVGPPMLISLHEY
jgi:hypothetical protein